MTVHDRRTFLAQSILSSASLAVGGIALSPRPAVAIEPIARQAGPFFKFSMAAYSYRDLLKSKKGDFSLEDFIRTCADLQLQGTELTSYYFPNEVTPEYLRKLKHLTFTLGLDISGTAVGNNFCVPAGPKRDEEIAGVKRWVDYAEIMGAPVIRIFSGNAKSGQSKENAHRLAVEGMEECCEYAGRHGVFLALENHGGLTETVDGLLGLVRDVKSPWFGVNLDSGNFHGADVYADLAKIAPYAVNVQVKMSVRPNHGKKQPSDLSRLATILKETGYRGYIVLEYEDDEDPKIACPRHVEALRKAFA